LKKPGFGKWRKNLRQDPKPSKQAEVKCGPAVAVLFLVSDCHNTCGNFCVAIYLPHSKLPQQRVVHGQITRLQIYKLETVPNDAHTTY
jgi:hypothetical protein